MEKNVPQAAVEKKITIPILSNVPEFTIRADSKFGIKAMVAVAREASNHLELDSQRVIKAKLREFDLYEEQNRPLPNISPAGREV
jgi:hypothetical protein